MTVLLVGIAVASAATPAWASAQMSATINPGFDTSPFKVVYQRALSIEYPDGGALFDELNGKEWIVEGEAGSADPNVQDLINRLNQGMADDSSQAKISDLDVSYSFHLTGRDSHTSIDYQVVLEGDLTGYVITRDSERALVDMAWRGITADGDIMIDGIEVNMPISIIKDKEPVAYSIIEGTEAEDLFNTSLINADFILAQPLVNWHSLFNPAGIGVDAGTFGLSDEISGFVLSTYAMGESGLREGRQVEQILDVEFVADRAYVAKSTQSPDSATIDVIGFSSAGILDDIEILGITPTTPEGYGTTSTQDFPVFIIYGMAAMAGIAGVAFFFVSNRALKNEKQGQQGIDPSRLVGYQTSSAAGGYQTNRGEAQLRDDSDYQSTRSVYDETPPSTVQSEPPPVVEEQEAACGCAASAEMNSECDCEMQGSCLCDGSCRCDSQTCKDHSSSMR